ncbi:MAG: threonine synthase [Planctomycetota bacterium]|jgi:threonine synthase
MYVTHLECSRCDKTYDADQIANLCECGMPLLVRYDLEKIKNNFHKEDLLGRVSSLWRYREMLPVKDPANIVTLGEGMTPLLHFKRLGEKVGLPNLFMKDEGILPTASFKSRGAAVGVSKAKELGVTRLAMPTNGNAGSAWSAFCAAAGIKATIVSPKSAPPITFLEAFQAGADLFLINGLITDAGATVAKAIKKHGWYDASTLKEPYRIEGKKTMGLEIAEQFGWEVPDVILYPTGGGVGIIGIYKALRELQEIGWIGDKMPRLVAVQAEGCAPIVKAWENQETESVKWEGAHTLAFGINVAKAIGDFLVLEAVYETDGCAIAVSDADILEKSKLATTTEGAWMCPEGAATLSAAMKLLDDGWIKNDERVVLLNTGAGLKYPETVSIDPPVLEIGEELPVSM